VRGSALFLLARDHGRGWLGVDDTQYNSVQLEHQKFYLSTVNFSVGNDAMVGAQLVFIVNNVWTYKNVRRIARDTKD
jgi:hypothetical protein